MSLSYIYVKAIDGKYYRYPTFRSKNNDWFVCFDEDDPPEIVIKKSCKKKPEEILDSIGIKYQKIRNRISSGRCFGSTGSIHSAYSWFFDLKEPIPIPENHEGIKDKIKGEGTWIGARL